MSKMEQKSAVQIIGKIFLGVLFALLMMSLLLFLCAFILSTGSVNMDVARQLAIGSCTISTFFGALLTAHRCGKRALPIGVGVGAVYFIVLLLLAPLCTSEVSLGTAQFPLMALCLCAGALAGLTGKKRKKRRRS